MKLGNFFWKLPWISLIRCIISWNAVASIVLIKIRQTTVRARFNCRCFKNLSHNNLFLCEFLWPLPLKEGGRESAQVAITVVSMRALSYRTFSPLGLVVLMLLRYCSYSIFLFNFSLIMYSFVIFYCRNSYEESRIFLHSAHNSCSDY